MTQPLPIVVSATEVGELPQPGLRVVHVAEGGAYQLAHLPGAALVDPRELVDGRPPAPGRLPDMARLERLFARLGHRPELHYLVYDDEGGGWAGRFAWTLDAIGHRRWSYLDGGLPAWHAAGRPIVRGPEDAATPPHPAAPSDPAAPSGPAAPEEPAAASRGALRLDPTVIAELEDVMAAITDDSQLIWDVRSPEEYRGERSGARRAGHVPTAVNLDWMRLKDPARSLRLVEGLGELLEAHGIDGGKRIITHCQTHHRSGLSYLVGRILGFADIRAYHGSWAEWGNRDDTPVVTGPAPGSPAAGRRG